MERGAPKRNRAIFDCDGRGYSVTPRNQTLDVEKSPAENIYGRPRMGMSIDIRYIRKEL
ncbi:hypothetical protein Elgi_59130 [Paenibacillus elgii]|nr:hypothetical protein Elgi_59130 [Paenibacillus elgii]